MVTTDYTARELTIRELKIAYQKEFINPWVVVLVVEFGSRPLYLLGEFNAPGVVYLRFSFDTVANLSRTPYVWTDGK